MALKKNQASTIGAVGGGVAGSFFGPAGTVVGAGVGGALGGMLGKDNSFSAPSFSDIDLASANPQLWAELQRMNATVGEAERLYNARRQGPSELELRQYGQARSNMQDQQAQQGLLGTSAGLSAEADSDARLQGAIRERAFQEQQSLFNNMAQQRAAYEQAIMGAQNQIVNPQMQAAQINYQQAQENDAARNQFYSGLATAGAGMYANNQNMAAMDKRMAQQQAMYPSIYQPNYNPYGAPPASPGYQYSQGVSNNNVPFWSR